MSQTTNCPFCFSNDLTAFITAKDYTVSGEKFQITKCNACTGMHTSNAPAQDLIADYYKSQSYISHSDTQEGFINKLYHFVRGITLASKKRIVKRFAVSTGKNILDIGAGTGSFLHTMKKAGWNTTGLEPDERARTVAFKNYELKHELPERLFELSENHYQAITMWHVLEHVHDLHEYVEQAKKLLVKGGLFIIAVPNYTSYDARHYKEFWAAYDVPRHLYHFSPESIKKLMHGKGYAYVRSYAMWFDSYYVSLLSEKYKTGKNNLLKALITGTISNVQALWKRRNCSSLIYIFRNA